jgi:glutathione synthase/RimK-type ligase-like ATP-grasp enzyme
MTIAFLRRPKLGRTSVKEIVRLMRTPDVVGVRHDRDRMPANVTRVIRWGCTADVGVRDVINTSAAIHEVNDKLNFRRKLDAISLCSKTWFSERQLREYVMNNNGLMPPVVVRPSHHAQGKNLHVCRTPQELAAAVARYPDNGYYINKLVDKVAEYRVAVVQGRAVWIAKKTPGNPQDVAWNVARGGRFDNVRFQDWPLKAVKKSIEAFNLSALDFGGVDVMVDADGECYILEINSAPSLTSPYRQECMAKAFDWMIQHGKQRIPLVADKGGYTKFIHPAIDGNARL